MKKFSKLFSLSLQCKDETPKKKKHEDESYDLINLDYIFHDDNPLDPWVVEREQLVLLTDVFLEDMDEEGDNYDDDDEVVP